MKGSCKGKVFSAEEVTENGCAEQGDKVIVLVDRRDMTSYKTQTHIVILWAGRGRK